MNSWHHVDSATLRPGNHSRATLGPNALIAACIFGLLGATALGCGSAAQHAQADPAPAADSNEEVGPGTALPPEAFEPKPAVPETPDTRTLEEKLAAAMSVIRADCVEVSSLDEMGAEERRVGSAVETRVAITSIERDDTYAWFWVKVHHDTDMQRGALIEASGELTLPVEIRTDEIRFRSTLTGAEGLDIGSEVIVAVCQWQNP